MSQNRNISSQIKFPIHLLQYFWWQLKKAPLLLTLHRECFCLASHGKKPHSLNEEMTILFYHPCLKLVWRSEKTSKHNSENTTWLDSVEMGYLTSLRKKRVVLLCWRKDLDKKLFRTPPCQPHSGSLCQKYIFLTCCKSHGLLRNWRDFRRFVFFEF